MIAINAIVFVNSIIYVTVQYTLGFNPIIFIITPVLFSLSFTTDVTIDIKGSGIINIIIIVIIKSTIVRTPIDQTRATTCVLANQVTLTSNEI